MRNAAILIIAWCMTLSAWAGTITYTLNATWVFPPYIPTNTGQQYDLVPPGSHFTWSFIEPTSFDTSLTYGAVGELSSCSGSNPFCGVYGSDEGFAGPDSVEFYADPDFGFGIFGLQGIATFKGSEVTFHYGEWDAAYGGGGAAAVTGTFTGSVIATPEPTTDILLGAGLLMLCLGAALRRRRLHRP